jgi:hypothetical protein
MHEGKFKLTGIALAAAVIVLIVWLGMLLWMTQRTDASEVIWARLFSVLSSLEAVAFAAAGALFGTSVQRQRVKDAHERADKADTRAAEAEKEAASNAQAAANGKALATAVKARAQGRSEGGVDRMSAGARGAGAQGDELLVIAEKLFPD